jgi:hypothetical protein
MQPKTDMNMTGMNVKMKWKDLRASKDESFFSNDVDDVHGICMLEFPFFFPPTIRGFLLLPIPLTGYSLILLL